MVVERTVSIATKSIPSEDQVLDIEAVVLNAHNNGFIKDVPVIGKDEEQGYHYLTIGCSERDYAFWYGYYWGVKLGRRIV